METITDRILDISNLKELLRFGGSMATKQLMATTGTLTEAGVRHILELCEALWLHSGNPADPHVEIREGKCSNGFVDVLRALRYTNICDTLAYHMRHAIEAKLIEMDYEGPPVHWAIGSDHAGAVFSHDVARYFGAQHDFTEKGVDGKQQLWKRFTIGPQEPVLQIEELVTTLGTLMAVRKGIRDGNPNPVTFMPVVGTLVHRSDVYEFQGAPIVYLAHYDIATWEREKCPLCAADSERITNPKKNWARLTGRM